MSAVRDPNQNTTFIYSNFYHLYKKNNLAKGVVLKSTLPEEKIETSPVRVISENDTKDFARWCTGESTSKESSPLDSLKSLREARKRLHYLVQEIDDLLKRE